jgi:hypothetical protein
MRHLKCESGSAILEFITFVLVGQLIVFAASISLATQLTSKVELQVMASKVARTIALGRDVQVPATVKLIQADCAGRLVCVILNRDDLKASAVSYR